MRLIKKEKVLDLVPYQIGK